MEVEIIAETPTEVDLFNVLNATETDHTARWYYDRFFGLNEEVYYLLECASREPDRADEIVRVCQEIYDERTQKIIENFGKNRPGEGFEFNLEEIKYDDPRGSLFEQRLRDDEVKRNE